MPSPLFIRPAKIFRRACWLSALFFASSPSLPSLVTVAQAQPSSFEGSALVPLPSQSDVVKARGQALAEALSRALEQAVAEVMPEARSRVYLVSGRARDYVTTYRVLQEGEVAGQFQIRVEVQLDLPRLQRDLGSPAAGSATPNPTTIYLCAAQTTAASTAALEAASGQLKETGAAVEIVPPSQCSQTPDLSALRGVAALLILSQSDSPAEMIRGTQPVQYGAQGRMKWQLFRPGREPMAQDGEAAGFGLDAATASVEAGRQAASVALDRLRQRVGPLSRTGTGVVVRLESLGSFAAYQQLLHVLASLPGVSRVEPRRFWAPARSVATEEATAQLLLQTSASVETLAAILGRTPLVGLRLQVMPLGEGELRVICAPLAAVPSASQPAENSEAPEAEKQP